MGINGQLAWLRRRQGIQPGQRPIDADLFCGSKGIFCAHQAVYGDTVVAQYERMSIGITLGHRPYILITVIKTCAGFLAFTSEPDLKRG